MRRRRPTAGSSSILSPRSASVLWALPNRVAALPSLVVPHPNDAIEHAKNQKPNAQGEPDGLVSNQALDDIGQSEKYDECREPTG